VKLTFDPPLVSTFDDDDNRKPTLAETQFMTKGIPTMPPGRTWTALFERGPDRKDRDDLPRAYDVTVTFRDSQNRKYSLPYRLDLDIFFGIRNLGIYDMHDAAEALREIKKTVGEWTDGHHGLAVFARDGDAKDERSREQMRKHREMFERNRREDGSIISEWVEQQMGSEWNEHQVRVEALPRSESRESIAARFRSRRRARTQVPRRLRAAERDSGHRRGLA
jgi:hypothetical protein